MERIVDVGLANPDHPIGDLLLVGCFEGEEPDRATLPGSLAEVAERLAQRPGWKGRDGQLAEAETGRQDLPLVALRGMGKRDQLHGRKLDKWLRESAVLASTQGTKRLVLALPDHPLTQGHVAAGRAARHLSLARYKFDRFTKPSEEEEPLQGVDLLLPGPVGDAHTHELQVAREVGLAIVFEKNLANTPPNVATPEWMAERAQELAERVGLEIQVLVREDMELKGMGGLLAVGGGSENAPRLVRLTWKGAESPRVALVGKGVTFDTGGISIKPAPDMDEMKWDKCGACTVLGLMQAAACLHLPVQLTAYLPLAENMPDGNAYRPGDILKMYDGQTVEVLNTDAEGRIILADAISWAAESHPNFLVEMSTLTGASVVALGVTGAGLYTPSDSLADALLSAAADAGERLWRMPLWPEFREAIKGTHSDLKNVAGRWGGANTAAAFLGAFVGQIEHWAHLDIAGPAYVGATGNGERGATGYGVALGVQWLRALVRE